MRLSRVDVGGFTLTMVRTNTLVIGSGAASLNAAVHLYDNGIHDVVIATDQLGGGTSNNSGSDKQTYYKLSLSGDNPDSPYDMARTLFDGGCMHGDIALVEATVSPQEFYHLAAVGVPFPHDRHGGYVGYKTDHDPRARATSAGPWTSNQMFTQLLAEVRRRGIAVLDSHEVIAILVHEHEGTTEAVGALAIDKDRMDDGCFGLALIQAGNVIMGTGGPGGIYRASVYPEGHLGSTGVALDAGAAAANLTEWQYGLASTSFRWNVSGTYQQVIPRYFSTEPDGSGEREFLNDYFADMGTLATDIFLKGYQWPFDPRKIDNMGSSMIDVLVYVETVVRGRKVYMDFVRNPSGSGGLEEFKFDLLSQEAFDYLRRSNASLERPIDRLRKMNPMAVELYAQHGIDIASEPLEVAVCAQHNNGGLIGNEWWESNVRHLFPVGEANGTHGVYRPGGSALNSGQVGGFRAAQFIANRYANAGLTDVEFIDLVAPQVIQRIQFIQRLARGGGQQHRSWREFREGMQARMSRCAAHVREPSEIDGAATDAREDLAELEAGSVKADCVRDIVPILQNRQLCLTHLAVLRSIQAYLAKGGGSRGSYLVLDKGGTRLPVDMGDLWRYRPELIDLRDCILEVRRDVEGDFEASWVPVRPIPDDDTWFENVWADYLEGEVFTRA